MNLLKKIIFLPIYLFVLFMLWPVLLFINIIWYYAKSFWYSFIIKKDIVFNEERYESLFNSPFFLYFTFVIQLVYSIMVYPIVAKTFLKKYVYFDGIMFSIVTVGTILFFWITVYLYYKKIGKKEKIIICTENHKKFIKTLLLPAGLIGIIVSIASVINMFLNDESKNEIINQFLKINWSNNLIGLSGLFLFSYLAALVSYLVLELVNHFYYNEDNYLFFIKKIDNLLN